MAYGSRVPKLPSLFRVIFEAGWSSSHPPPSLTVSLTRPASQGEHVLSPKARFCPAGHGRQAVFPSLATEPGLQGVQKAVLAFGAIVSPVHGEQTSSLKARFCPAGQGTQTVLSSFSSKPGSHGRQLVWLSSAKPWAHVVHSVCPPKLMLLPSHGTHAVASERVWWPLSHLRHSDCPAAEL